METTELFNAADAALTADPAPSRVLADFERRGLFAAPPFSALAAMKHTPQSPKHHPEGSVWNHTLLVADEAAKRKGFASDARAFMWAALLHDVGKPAVTRRRGDKLTAYGHDRQGGTLARAFLDALTEDEGFKTRVVYLVRYHMQPLFSAKKLPFLDLPGMRAGGRISDVALLSLCDRLGRGAPDAAAERQGIRDFLTLCGEDPDPPWLAG